jgi:DNA-binding winged helix-turn-helix (wHTH) protein
MVDEVEVVYTFGPPKDPQRFVLDRGGLKTNGEEILPDQKLLTLQVLHLFVSEPNRIFTWEDLASIRVRENIHVDAKAFAKNYVKNIRQALDDVEAIKTEEGKGYKFGWEVVRSPLPTDPFPELHKYGVPPSKAAFLEAVDRGELEIVRCFTEAPDAQRVLDAKSSDGKTALMVALERHHIAIAKLIVASISRVHSSLTTAREIIDAHRPTDGKTALMIAVEMNETEIVERLLGTKANPNSKDRSGSNAYGIARAATKGNDQILASLIEAGASISCDQQDLVWAEQQNCPKFACSLIKLGVPNVISEARAGQARGFGCLLIALIPLAGSAYWTVTVFPKNGDGVFWAGVVTLVCSLVVWLTIEEIRSGRRRVKFFKSLHNSEPPEK